MIPFFKNYHLLDAALAVILTMLVATSALGSNNCDGAVPYQEKRTEDKPYLTKEFRVDGPGIFEASTFAGNIHVETTSDTSLVKVEVYLERGYALWSGSKNLDNYRITLEQRGNRILSSAEKKTDKQSFFSDRVHISYKVYLPQKMSVRLKTSAGNIFLSGVQGDHSLKSNAGNISVENVQGYIKSYTSGGHIDIERSKGTIYGHTNGGNILLDNNKGELRFRSNGGQLIAQRISGTMVSQINGGDIKAQFIHLSKGVSLQTSAGDIYVELPGDTGFNINLSGSSIEFPSGSDFSGEYDSRNVQGKLFEGGAPVSLTTGFGKITLRIEKER